MKKKKFKDCITIFGASRRIGVKRETFQNWVDEGRIESEDGHVLLSTVDDIQETLNSYISLESFLWKHNNDRFNAKYANNRNKYLEYLDDNKFFGIPVVYADEFPYPYEARVTLYFDINDIQQLDDCSEIFFKYFGLSDSEICKKLIEECINQSVQSILTSFMKSIDKYGPSVISFVNAAKDVDLLNVTDEELARINDEIEYVQGQELFAGYIEYAKTILPLNLGKITLKERHSCFDNGAYSYEVVVAIAKAIFNESEIASNKVIEKAFEKSISFETWLFISAFFSCGWRGDTICRDWPYLSDDAIREIGINVDTIREDIINERIDESLYYEIGAFLEKSVELAAIKNHKTGRGSDLSAPMGKQEKIFQGRMALISTYHYHKDGSGRLVLSRMSDYLNFQRFRDIFGDSVYKLLGRRNLWSTKLTKSYEQLIERTARKKGAEMMTANALASYARNHNNVDTIAIYLRDHGLDGETAEVVLSLMLDRGVFGSIRYAEMQAAFPDAFNRLTAQEQTLFLEACSVSAYEMEILAADYSAEAKLRESFAEGDEETARTILYEMFSIAQGFGKAKDYGIYCKKRALGYACEHPVFLKCLINVCPYLMFTEAGVKTLVREIVEYEKKARVTGNPKYVAILRKVILPTYKNILSEYSERMNADESKAFKMLIRNYYDEFTKEN